MNKFSGYLRFFLMLVIMFAVIPVYAALHCSQCGKNINGRKFRRQHSIENYIVDFYCAEEKLVIELDGKIHLNQKEMDFERDKRLKELGYNVLRFENERVFRELEKVVCIIEANFKTINKFGSELTPPLE